MWRPVPRVFCPFSARVAMTFATAARVISRLMMGSVTLTTVFSRVKMVRDMKKEDKQKGRK